MWKPEPRGFRAQESQAHVDFDYNFFKHPLPDFDFSCCPFEVPCIFPSWHRISALPGDGMNSTRSGQVEGVCTSPPLKMGLREGGTGIPLVSLGIGCIPAPRFLPRCQSERQAIKAAAKVAAKGPQINLEPPSGTRAPWFEFAGRGSAVSWVGWIELGFPEPSPPTVLKGLDALPSFPIETFMAWANQHEL